MSNYGIKVGTDIDNNTDKQLALTSKYSYLKILKWGNAQFTTNGSGVGTVSVAHGLGYTPIVMVFKKFDAQYTFLSTTTYTDSFRDVESYNSYDPNQSGFEFDADDTNLTISTTTTIYGSNPVSNSTTYYFRYFIFVDLSKEFTGDSSISLPNNYGFKVSKPGKNVLTAEEYEMAMSSKYKSLQYFSNHVLSSSLTLPEMFASTFDSSVEQATYVDFNHNLGYQPFFLVFSDLATAYLYEAPYTNVAVAGGGYSDGKEEVSAFCDSSRVRVMFRRESNVINGDYGESYSSKTISINVIIFAEDLTGAES